MDYSEFAKKVKAKYPDYNDLGDLELAQKIVAKYPNDYSDVTFPSQFHQEQIATKPPGIIQTGIDTAKATLAPFSTALNAGVKLSQSEQAPAALAALGMGAATGGLGAIPAVGLAASGALGAIPAAAAVGLAGAGGEAYRQLFSQGGAQNPEDAKKIGVRGLEQAVGELGIRAIPPVIQKLAPTVLQVFEKIPGEALKRVIARWQDMPPALKSVLGNQAAVDRFGIAKLNEVQKGLKVARTEAGKEVEKALVGFHQKVQGQPVVDAAPVAQALRDTLANAQAGDTAVEAAMSQAEIKRLTRVADAIDKSPLKTPAEAVALRRALDDLTNFKRGAATPVTSSLGQRATREMSGALRSSIQDAAQAANYTPLAEANANFHRIAGIYDNAGEIFATKSVSQTALLKRLDSLSSMYYKGGLPRQILEDMATTIPNGAGPVNHLLDAVAARALERPPQGTPSGVVLNVIRLLGAPRFVGGAIRAAYTIAPARRLVSTVGAAGVDAALNPPPVQPQP